MTRNPPSGLGRRVWKFIRTTSWIEFNGVWFWVFADGTPDPTEPKCRLECPYHNVVALEIIRRQAENSLRNEA
jgi:hypothetical protein